MNKELDSTYWKNRYNDGTARWDLGHVSMPLKAYIDTLENKAVRILIPGAGYGHEALYLKSQGFLHVTVLDYALEPLKTLDALLPPDHGYTLVYEDFFTHTGCYDLILEQTFYCALSLRFRESYFKHMHALLTTNGVLVGLLFYFEQVNPGPPFSCTPEDYERMARVHFYIMSLEPCLNSEPSRAGKELFLQLLKKEHGN